MLFKKQANFDVINVRTNNKKRWETLLSLALDQIESSFSFISLEWILIEEQQIPEQIKEKWCSCWKFSFGFRFSIDKKHILNRKYLFTYWRKCFLWNWKCCTSKTCLLKLSIICSFGSIFYCSIAIAIEATSSKCNFYASFLSKYRKYLFTFEHYVFSLSSRVKYLLFKRNIF